MSNVSLSGAISGLDTSSLVNQLMTAESQPQTTLKNRQTAAQKAADAYTSLITSLKSLATQSATLAKTSTWQGSAATSSSPSVTATATGNATGTLTFDVTAVAAAHTLVSNGTVASTNSSVVSSGSLAVKSADGLTTKGTINVGNGTLSEVVAGINASDLGLRAAAVQVGAGHYRLQVTSATSGAASAFTLGGVDGFGGGAQVNVLTAGADATLTIGQNLATQYQVTSSTNTFANLVPGLSFTVSKPETGVTVDAKLDGTTVATQIQSLVDATNTALSTLKTNTAYDFTKRTGAALYGDSSIRTLQQQILSSVSGTSAAGVQLTRDGTLTFDKTAFTKAFQADPAGTAAAFGARSSFTPNTGVLGNASLLSSTSGTRSGSYAVQVSAAAAREEWSSVAADLSGKTVVITKGSLMATYTVGVGESMSDAVAAINSRAAAAGISMTASVNIPAVLFTANSGGSAEAFSVTVDAVAATKVTAGRDVTGTINGQAASGLGSILTLNKAGDAANGLSLNLNVTDADVTASGGDIGTVSFRPGLAQRLSTLLNDATDSATGSLAQAQKSRANDVKTFQDQIDAWDIRLEARRTTLTRQFTAMETALASLKSSSSAITNLLATSTPI